jgi:hypothetical protein
MSSRDSFMLRVLCRSCLVVAYLYMVTLPSFVRIYFELPPRTFWPGWTRRLFCFEIWGSPEMLLSESVKTFMKSADFSRSSLSLSVRFAVTGLTSPPTNLWWFIFCGVFNNFPNLSSMLCLRFLWGEIPLRSSALASYVSSPIINDLAMYPSLSWLLF